jgi:hypothetical protein
VVCNAYTNTLNRLRFKFVSVRNSAPVFWLVSLTRFHCQCQTGTYYMFLHLGRQMSHFRGCWILFIWMDAICFFICCVFSDASSRAWPQTVLSPWRPGIVHLRFVVDKVALGPDFLRVLPLPLPNLITPNVPFLALSHRGWCSGPACGPSA